MFNNSTFTNATNSTNGTEPGPGPGPRPSPQVDVVEMVLYCLLALLIVVENLPMIIAFYVNRQLRTKANLLLMSLIMANMVTGTISVPLWVYISVTYTIRGLLYDFYLFLDVITIGSSALSITLMSLERCYALIKPIKHRNIRKRTIKVTVLVIWVLASFSGSLIEFLPLTMKKYYGVIVTSILFFVPLIFTLGANGIIVYIARTYSRKRGVTSFKKELRIAVSVALAVGPFLILWSPFFTLNFTFAFCMAKKFKSSGCAGLMVLPFNYPWILPVSKWLQYGHPMLVPIIYGLRDKEFRRTVVKGLLCLCCKNPRLPNKRDDANRNPYLRREVADQISFGVPVRRENHLESIQRGGEPIVLTAFQNCSRPSANDSDSSILGELQIPKISEGPQIPKCDLEIVLHEQKF